MEPRKTKIADQRDAEVIGRDEERSRIGEWLEATRPSMLLIEGEAGIGKSTLWADGVGRATERGDRVLAWRAGEAERDLAFVVLRALFDDPAAEPAIRSLAAPRRRALDAALVRGDGDGGRRDRTDRCRPDRRRRDRRPSNDGARSPAGGRHRRPAVVRRTESRCHRIRGQAPRRRRGRVPLRSPDDDAVDRSRSGRRPGCWHRADRGRAAVGRSARAPPARPPGDRPPATAPRPDPRGERRKPVRGDGDQPLDRGPRARALARRAVPGPAARRATRA